MRNRFCASFRMAENAKRTPELTRKVKNCNVPRNKIKSDIFWQKSYRLEWYLIICHYLNLYVHCISFITRLFLLWKLTGAKSNFETMCLQERNQYFYGPVVLNRYDDHVKMARFSKASGCDRQQHNPGVKWQRQGRTRYGWGNSRGKES